MTVSVIAGVTSDNLAQDHLVVSRSGTITRAATANPPAYAAGQVIADATTGPILTIAPMTSQPGGFVQLSRLSLLKSGPSMTNAKFSIYLFSAAPQNLSGDYASLSTAKGGDDPYRWIFV